MESNRGCCIARYAAGGEYNNTKIDRIMLRFRPIAPKPDRGGGSVSELKSNGGVAFKRAKRRYVKDSSKKYCRKRKVVSEETKNFNSFAKESVVNMKTLSLLPESPVFDHLSTQPAKPEGFGFDLDLALKKKVQQTETMKSVLITCCNNKMVTPQPMRPMGSCVIVERVTDACGDDGGEVLGRSDEERKMSLERDTCPGFISDRLNRVTWTNEAYRKMVNQGGGGGEERPEMTWLVLKEKLPPCSGSGSGSGGDGWCSTLVCRVRVQYTCKERNSLTVPCDVWIMDGGGFAWRLDLQAALSLDRLNRVTWTNQAYRKMVNQGGGGGEERPEMTWLVLKEKLPPCSDSGGDGWCSTLVYRVRVQYTCKERNSLTVPCDVWRMDGGGFAWRLDLQAALSLGR